MPSLTPLLNNPLLIFRYPLLLFLISALVLWLSGWIAASFFRTAKAHAAAEGQGFVVIQGATLTLLGLIIGFTFSMALDRYDQRKNLEEEEANAIGTEYLRADLLPAADGAKLRALLLSYLDERILFYEARDEGDEGPIDRRTAALEAELWSAVLAPASAQPTPVAALALAGMNDVFNSQGYTQAAWWNRIPITAWVLMVAIALCANVLMGIGAKSGKASSRVLLILPLIIAIAFLLVADIDSPRRGLIRVVPQNLLSLSQSLRAR
jgi:hypothetical protein